MPKLINTHRQIIADSEYLSVSHLLEVNKHNLRDLLLNYARVSSIDIEGVSLHRAVLNESVFYRCDFSNCIFKDAHLNKCEFVDCKFNNANFEGVFINRVKLEGCKLNGLDLTKAATINNMTICEIEVSRGR